MSNIICKPVVDNLNSNYIILFQHGELSTPIRVLNDYEAQLLACDLAGCLDNHRIKLIIENLQKMIKE